MVSSSKKVFSFYDDLWFHNKSRNYRELSNKHANTRNLLFESCTTHMVKVVKDLSLSMPK